MTFICNFTIIKKWMSFATSGLITHYSLLITHHSSLYFLLPAAVLLSTCVVSLTSSSGNSIQHDVPLLCLGFFLPTCCPSGARTNSNFSIFYRHFAPTAQDSISIFNLSTDILPKRERNIHFDHSTDISPVRGKS
jgi:hypothetical protein